MFVDQSAEFDYTVTWSWDWPFATGRVKAYPEVSFASKFGNRPSANTFIPAVVSELPDIYIDYAYSLSNQTVEPNYYRYNVALESWFHDIRDAPAAFENVAYEVMLWLERDDKTDERYFRPGGAYQYDVVIDGQNYGLWMGAHSSWYYLAYVLRDSNDTREGTINWRAVIEHAASVAPDFTPPSATQSISFSETQMTGVELGTEIISGAGTFELREFNVYTTDP